MRIAISGKSGCGNTTVSRIVAERLKLKLINFTFRDLAKERDISFSELHALASTDSSIDRDLDQKQLEMASSGNCVLGSRLAVWLLSDADLKVYLIGEPKLRARRIARREQIPYNKALINMTERDTEDRRRYLSLYQINIDDYHHVDIEIDTAALDQHEVAEVIVDKILFKQ